jgi:hypothetical protein
VVREAAIKRRTLKNLYLSGISADQPTAAQLWRISGAPLLF